MKKILLIATGIVLLAAGIFVARTFFPCSQSCTAKQSTTAETVSFRCGNDEEEASVLRLKVQKVVGSEKDSEKLKEAVMKVNGVKKVSACTHSGTVSISYDKSVNSDVASLTSAVKNAGYKYEMLGGSCCKSKGKSDNKSCESKKDKQI